VKDGVTGDAVPWVRLVEDDVYGGVAGAIDQLPTLVSVLVYHDGHPGTNMKMAGTGMITLLKVGYN
jgi:hypothetical protein